MLMAGVGMSLCIEVAVAGLLGWWIGSQVDRRWGLRPFGMIGGIVVFLGVSFWHLVRVLRAYDKQMNQESENRDGV